MRSISHLRTSLCSHSGAGGDGGGDGRNNKFDEAAICDGGVDTGGEGAGWYGDDTAPTMINFQKR